MGNRTYETVNGVQTAYTVDNNDRLTQQGGTTYTYDNNGNTLTETTGGNTISYTYSAKNTLQSRTENGVTTTYTYNADGIRTSKTQGATITDYLIDDNRDYAQVLEESHNGTVIVRYHYGDDLISQDRSGIIRYYHMDGLGSVRSLSDPTGNITDTVDYTAFGSIVNQTGVTENNYWFAGEQLDAESGNYYLRARYMNPNTGTFLTLDTWMGINHDPITLHKYLYANADPVNGIDPSGKFTVMGLMATSLAVVGATYTSASIYFYTEDIYFNNDEYVDTIYAAKKVYRRLQWSEPEKYGGLNPTFTTVLWPGGTGNTVGSWVNLNLAAFGPRLQKDELVRFIGTVAHESQHAVVDLWKQQQ